jgi:very-short-patch-repair endonuclease
LAREQEGVVATWQLLERGMTRDAVRHQTAALRRIHDGVWVTGDAPLTRRQRVWAAALTSPGRVVSHASAGDAYGFRPWQAGFEVVTERGNGGPRHQDGVLVCRTGHIDATDLHGLPITTPERTIADLWPALHERARTKMLREALRLRATTVPRLDAHLSNAPPRRRPSTLTRFCKRYEHLQLHRCRSDAEARAVELIADARLPIPDINHRRATEEADLSWPERRLIVEIDGDRFHRDKAEDARKTAIWKAAGWRVRRARSDDVFDTPDAFTAAVKRWLRDPA